MDSLFAKTILLLASLFTILTGTDYVKISSDSLNYDFKTNDQTPIYYYLNTENTGIKKVRFDVTSLSNWVSVYKESDQPSTKTSLELAQYAPLIFVLEIHPERLPDGINKTKVTVEAVDLQDYSTLELKEVSITVNKNLKPSPEIQPQISPAQIVTPEISPAAAPTFTPTLSPLIKTPPPIINKTSPVKTPSSVFSLTPSPTPPSSLSPTLKQIQSLIDSIRLFLKRISN